MNKDLITIRQKEFTHLDDRNGFNKAKFGSSSVRAIAQSQSQSRWMRPNERIRNENEPDAKSKKKNKEKEKKTRNKRRRIGMATRLLCVNGSRPITNYHAKRPTSRWRRRTAMKSARSSRSRSQSIYHRADDVAAADVAQVDSHGERHAVVKSPERADPFPSNTQCDPTQLISLS